MSRFESLSTHVVVSVDDEKDDRFASGWKPVPDVKPTSRKS